MLDDVARNRRSDRAQRVGLRRKRRRDSEKKVGCRVRTIRKAEENVESTSGTILEAEKAVGHDDSGRPRVGVGHTGVSLNATSPSDIQIGRTCLRN
jgi:hypothetical protein